MKRFPFLDWVSAAWFGVVVWVVALNAIIRESWFGGLAKGIDLLPSRLSAVVFASWWLVFLLGWCVPLIIAYVAFATPSDNECEIALSLFIDIGRTGVS